MKKGGKESWIGVSAGILLVLVAVSWTLLSSHFVFGERHAERPIVEFLILYLVGWFAYVIGVFVLGRKNKGFSLTFILVIGLAARIALLPSGPIQENDLYRYVLDGQVVLHGESPYEFSPLVISELGAPGLRKSLLTSSAKGVLRRIGYPEVPTVYPPAAQWAFAAGALLTGWNWMGQRLVFLIFDVLVLIALLTLLKMLFISPSWVLVYAWNPLVLKEITNSAHLDVMVAFFLVVMVLGLLKMERSASLAGCVTAACAFGLAILSKLYPVLLSPTLLLFVLRRRFGTLSILALSGLTVATVFVGYLPFLSVGTEPLAAGMVTYGSQWRMNDGAFALLSWISSHPRFWTALLVLAASVAVPLVRKSRGVAELAGDIQWVLLFWFLLLPAPFPWYAVPLIALSAVRSRKSPSQIVVLLSGVLVLYYLSFLYEYRGYSADWWVWTRAVEHTAIWLTLLAGMLLSSGPGARIRKVFRCCNIRL